MTLVRSRACTCQSWSGLLAQPGQSVTSHFTKPASAPAATMAAFLDAWLDMAMMNFGLGNLSQATASFTAFSTWSPFRGGM